jgi:hypothetical protein
MGGLAMSFHFFFRGGGSKKLWNPAKLDTQLWLDAADAGTITLNGSNVSQWNDKSGKGRNLTQVTGARQPGYVTAGLNNLNTVQNTAGTKYMVSAASGIFRNQGFGFMAVVVKHITAADASTTLPCVFVSNGASGTGARFTFTPFPGGSTNRLSIHAKRLDADGNSYAVSSTTRASVSDTFIVECGSVSWATAKANHWTNGTQDLTNSTFLTSGNTSDTNSLGVSVFAQNNGNNAITAGTELAEIICVQDSLSEPDRLKIEGYLAWKWGLVSSLPASHPYKNKRPTV